MSISICFQGTGYALLRVPLRSPPSRLRDTLKDIRDPISHLLCYFILKRIDSEDDIESILRFLSHSVLRFHSTKE